MPWYTENENDQSFEAREFRKYRDEARKRMELMLTVLATAPNPTYERLEVMGEVGALLAGKGNSLTSAELREDGTDG